MGGLEEWRRQATLIFFIPIFGIVICIGCGTSCTIFKGKCFRFAIKINYLNGIHAIPSQPLSSL